MTSKQIERLMAKSQKLQIKISQRLTEREYAMLNEIIDIEIELALECDR